MKIKNIKLLSLFALLLLLFVCCTTRTTSRRGTIYVETIGGLGNVLFQIASAYGVAKDAGYDLCVWSHAIPHDNDESQFKRYAFLWPRINKDGHLPGSSLPFPDGTVEYSEPKFSAYVSPREIVKSGAYRIKLGGYFQNERYFERYASEIRDLFKEPPEIKAKVDALATYHKAAEKYFIHVRLGDFVGSKIHFVDLTSYYTRAIEYVRQKDPAAQFIISTDQPDQLHKVYPQLSSMNIVSIPNDIECFYFLSRCKGGICANSTFSWWAAYMIQPTPGKIVTIPNKILTTDAALKMSGAVILEA